MIRRFSLYGFLKNQRYFEAWWLLAFLDKGISFTTWGLLIGFRELMINVMEVPSGAMADLFGRRKAMILSFVAYIVSFILFGAASSLPLLFVGMAFFAVGDAFRTGTHKAMIFTWLRLEGRVDERTRTYGYTRSWSQYGSALSVVLGSVIVFLTGDYRYVFYVAALPYLAGIVNFLGYPEALDAGTAEGRVSVRDVVRHLKTALRLCLKKADLRRVLLESMGWAGIFKAVKDYLQPVLALAAAAWLVRGATDGEFADAHSTALLLGPVYVGLYLLSAAASRNTHRIVRTPGGEDQAARGLWLMSVVAFALLVTAAAGSVTVLMILGFVLLHVLQNFWRPVLVSRFDAHAAHEQKATILSIESQAGSLCAAIVAPLMGMTLDRLRASGVSGPTAFWPVGALGVLVALGFVLTSPKKTPVAPEEDPGTD